MPDRSGTVLLVEDDAATADAIGRVLQAAGWQVAIAPNGMRALEWLGREGAPSAIIADRRMPWMTGPELLRAIRSSDDLRAVPFIEITADRASEAEPGLTASLRKPFSGDELVDTIELVVSEAAALVASSPAPQR